MSALAIVENYQDPGVAGVEQYWQELERLELLQSTGAITRNEYFARWIVLEKNHPNQIQ